MTVAAGTRLGPYEVDALLGAGGMGEVWKARDTRLGREVAIKILSPAVAQSDQFRARFEREARTISSLNHPNICTLFDVGQESGSHFLVMELIDGASLADRLLEGPLPLDQVLRFGAQIAEALDRAHKQGIVHRDLKPGNVMITKGGAKLLDFGLARSGTDAGFVVPDMMTEARPLTQEGTVLGTFQYMSPEQLAGEEADVRTDIFALGCVLYEMVTGQRAFQGKNKTSLIGAIVSGEPRPISSLQPLAPPMLEHVIRKCLAKDPDERWQSAHDIAEELKWTAEAGSQAGVAAPTVRRRRSRETLAWALCAVLAAGVLASIAYFVAGRRGAPSRFYRSSIVLPSYPDYYSGPMAIAPDGQSFAYAAQDATGRRILWVRRFGEAAPLALSSATEASVPFWSADGQSLAYTGPGGKLHKVSSSGGVPEIITVTSEIGARGGTWSADGTILHAPAPDSGIFRVASTGGESVPLTNPAKLGHHGHGWPVLLPDGKHLVFLGLRKAGTQTAQGIYFASLDGSTEPRFVTPSDSNAAYVAPGYLLFCRDGVLRAVRFDADAGTVSGEPVSIGPVQNTTRYAAGIFSASSTGSLLYQEKGSEELSELLWVDRQGSRLGAVGTPGYWWSPRLSHDGKRVAVDKSESGGNGDIWILETARPGATRLTFDPANESSPFWMPGDAEVVYFLDRDRSNPDLMLRKTGAAGERALTATPAVSEIPTDITADGRFIVIESRTNGSRSGMDITVHSVESKTTVPFLQGPFDEEAATVSPDGKWVAYLSNESGRYEVYVQSFPVAATQWQISTSGGTMPKWSPDGRELYYLAADSRLMSVKVAASASTFQAELPQALFPVRLRDATFAQYDLSPDGKRFLLNSIAPRTDAPLTLLVNWQDKFFPKEK